MITLAIPFPTIDPVLVSVGPFAIRWYALAYVVGLVGGWLYARRLISDPKLWNGSPPAKPDAIDDLLIYATFGVILGGRAVFVLVYNLDYYWLNPIEIPQLWHGGMAFHGGLLGAALAAIVYARRNAIGPLSLLDVCAAVAPIGLFLGRLANFINGELWGRVSQVPWAMVFPNGGPDPRHPSQLYQASLEGVALFLILTILVRRGAFNRPGLVAGTFAAGYGIARIIGEVFREPDAQLGFLWGGLTMGMLLSLPMIPLGLWLILRARKAA